MIMKTFKKLNSMILAFVVTFANVTAFAEANVIYMPTRPAATIEQTFSNQINPSSNVITPESEVSSISSYTQASIDYVNVYDIVEQNNNFYCYENGNLVRNGWRRISKYSYSLVAPVDGFYFTYIWAYFTTSGAALKGSSGSIRKAKIDDHTYAFNEYGQLLTGFFNENGDMWNESEGEDPFDLIDDGGTLYHAAEDSGALTSGWYRLNNTTSRYPNKTTIWMYFHPNTFKIIRSTGSNYKSLTVDGKTYAFDDKGVMLTGFEATQYNEEHGGSSKTVYFGEDGAEIRSGFYNVDMSDDLNYERFEDYDDYDEDITIYLSKNGKVFTNVIKKINSSYYGFDHNGVVLKGLTVWNSGNYITTIDTESTDGKNFIMTGKYATKNGGSATLNSSDALHYFNSRGRRITNGASIEFADNTYHFSATNGGGIDGSNSERYYVHGLLIKPEAGVRYGVFILSPTKENYTMAELVNTDNVIVSSNGAVISSKTVQEDDDDNYWLISSKSLINIYSVPIKVTGGSYYFKSENKDGDESWIPFGEKDRGGKTCVTQVVPNGTKVSGGATSSYQVKLSSDAAINFNIR